MTVEDLHPRDEHVGRTFTAPHDELYRAMRGFLNDLKGAEETYRKEVAQIRAKLQIPVQYTETPDVERYSLAVQVFAAMTIEAAISFYAVLRFGGEHHDEPVFLTRVEKVLRRLIIRSFAELGVDGVVRVIDREPGLAHLLRFPAAVVNAQAEDRLLCCMVQALPSDACPCVEEKSEAMGRVGRFRHSSFARGGAGARRQYAATLQLTNTLKLLHR